MFAILPSERKVHNCGIPSGRFSIESVGATLAVARKAVRFCQCLTGFSCALFQGVAEPARLGVVASLQLYRSTLCHCEERQRRGNLSVEIATSLRSSR